MTCKRLFTKGAFLALALGALAPGLAEAQQAPPERRRITDADRKAAAEARKAAQGGQATSPAAKPSAAPSGTVIQVQPKDGAK